jgi:glycosyltransferase involved in cell wall biosynthesis
MSANRRVLFYSDASEYGGHEAMTAEAVGHLCRRNELEVSFAYYKGNDRLSGRLESIKNATGNLRLIPIPFRSRSLQAVRTLFSRGQIRRIEALMKNNDPELVIISQGRIEAGSAGLMAAKRVGIRTISYIPMAHSVSVSGKPIAVTLRDALNRYFYRLPDKYITISQGARDMLLARGAKADITVVPNGVERINIQKSDRTGFREAHGIRESEYAVAVIGRIEFRQKRQDFALQAVAHCRQQLKDWKFLFIGDGPDEENLRKMIADFGLEELALVLPWSPARAHFYAGIDMLLIPSRFEGVPLVMLEAMSCGLRIVASDIDGMADNLPKSWLFPYEDSKAMINTLIRVRADNVSVLLEENRKQVASENTFTEFGFRFANAVLGEPVALRGKGRKQ